MYDIVLGRSSGDLKKYGKKGTVLIGKQYVKMGQTSSLSNPIYMDVARAHAMLICGKRGGGKCLYGDSEITLADNSIETIQSLFDKLSKVGILDSRKDDYYKLQEDFFVKSFDLEKKKFLNKKVTHVFRRKIKEQLVEWSYFDVQKNKKKLVSTKDHKILVFKNNDEVENFFWTNYDRKDNFECFFGFDKDSNKFGSCFNLKEEKIIEYEGYVYDLTVEDTHNFIANNIIVHNSYTMGSIAEGLADIDPEVSKNLAFVLLDTMGVYWSMKYPNRKDDELLKEWGLEGKGLNVQIYVPGGFFNKYKEDGIPVDFPLYIRPSELSIEDWMNAFKLHTDDSIGVAVQRVINRLIDSGKNYSIDDILDETENDSRLDNTTKLAVVNRFENCKTWGIFSKDATKIRDIFAGGFVTVLDLSPYVSMPGGWEVKALALGIIAKKIFVERMMVRKREELFDIVNKTQVVKKQDVDDDLPMPWLIVDECLPYDSKILTNKGILSIGEIVENFNIVDGLCTFSYDLDKKVFDYYKITKVYDKGEKEIIELRTETGRKIKCTPDHKVLDEKGFIQAKDAQCLATPVNGILTFEKIVEKISKKGEKVYDITVDKVHNFVANDFVVHNCHEFLPRDGNAPSTQALMTILREGRQPGVSLIMATQQPGKIHTDAITQSDIVLSHRITASFDLEALDKIFLSYDSKGSKNLFNSMPRTKGCAIIMDDKNERLHTMQVKPRITWHGGEDPNAIREIEDEFDFN